MTWTLFSMQRAASLSRYISLRSFVKFVIRSISKLLNSKLISDFFKIWNMTDDDLIKGSDWYGFKYANIETLTSNLKTVFSKFKMADPL